MLRKHQILFLLFCLSNILLINPKTKKSDKKIKIIPSDEVFFENNYNELDDSLETAQLIIQSNNQESNFILKPFNKIDIPEIPLLTSDPEEQVFIKELGVDIVRVAERSVVTGEDYIAKYTDAQSAKTIHEYKKKCILLQEKGDLYSLFNEVSRLHHIVMKNGKKNTITDYISLAIAEKIYSNPIATILYTIRHTSIRKAWGELLNLRIQILEQAIANHVTTNTKLKELLIEQYDFDAIHVACNCYMSRDDHIDITHYKSILSNDLKQILSTIQNENLSIAHAELINLKKQILEHVKSRNIIDPLQQKQFIIKNFNCNILKLAYKIYRARLDHKTLICHFEFLAVQKAIIKALNDNKHNYESLTQALHRLTQFVFRNAELSKLNLDSETKTSISETINIIEKTHDHAEFASKIIFINVMLEKIQNKVETIVYVEPSLSEQPQEPLIQAIKNFLRD